MKEEEFKSKMENYLNEIEIKLTEEQMLQFYKYM